MIIRRLLLSLLSLRFAQAQWDLFGGWQQPQQQQAWGQQQWGQQWPQQQQQQQQTLFPNLFNQFTLAPPPTTTTTTTAAPAVRLEDIPNPDLEQGNWPLPNPNDWPVGPDWNDPRNSWQGEFGWGGKDQGNAVVSAEGTRRRV